MKLPTLKSATAVLAASFAISLSATAAHAASDDSPSVTVHFSDLNTQTDAGSKTLYRRLKQASKQVCGDESSAVELYQIRNIETCKQVALENAVATIDQPRLIDLYDRSYPREPLVPSPSRVATIYPVEKVSVMQADGSVVEVVVLAVHRRSAG